MLPSAESTTAFAERLGNILHAGDSLLLTGPVGAGKSHFARALIQARLARLGRFEDVPSPSFTLVQEYDLGDVVLWHADLYRLGNPLDCAELGLEQAFEEAICLIEWPDRLGWMTPQGALHLVFSMAADPEERSLTIRSDDPGWAERLAGCACWAGRGADPAHYPGQTSDEDAR